MKSKNVIRNFILAGIVIATLGGESALAKPLVSVEPASHYVVIGNTISVQIDASDVLDLYAYQFDLTFDPTFLSATSVTEEAFLATGGTTYFVPGTIDNTTGSITFIANTLIGPVAGVNGSGSLALVQFLALARGTSSIELSNVVLLDSSYPDPVNIQADTAGGQIEVIPEPSSLWLVAIGVIGLGRRRWSRMSEHRPDLGCHRAFLISPSGGG